MILRILSLHQIKHILEVRESKRLEISEVNCVMVIFEYVAEDQSVQWQLLRLFRLVLVTRNHLMVPVIVRLDMSDEERDLLRIHGLLFSMYCGCI